MSKRRVFHIARELNISNEAVIEFLGKRDKSISKPMSAVSDELYEAICQEYKKETAPVSEAESFRQKLKEKKMLEELRRNKARMELEERLRVATRLAEERPKRLREAKEMAARKVEQPALQAEGPADVLPEKEAELKPKAEPSVVDLISQAKKEIDRQKKEAAEREKVEEQVEEAKPEAKKAPAKKEERKKQPTPEELALQAEAAEAEATTAEVPEPVEQDQDGKLAEAAEPPTAETAKAAPPAESPTPAKKPTVSKKKGKKKKKRKISEEEITASIKQTLAAMEETKPKRRKRKAKAVGELGEQEESNVIKVSEFITAAELADVLEVEPNEVIKKCLELGMMVSINQRLDMDTIVAVADEFGCEVEIEQEYGTELVEEGEEEEEDEKDLVPRPPIVTIMGHVDHGKTSLLDYIRKSNIIAGEAGGITQHIGAYEVSLGSREITFLDTPGHEAFTAMRARGAQVTDIVILIVAADDGVQPQTIEAINHAQAANVPIVVAISKIDKPNANVEKVKKDLAEHNILVEDWGGKYQCAEISSKTGQGVDRLLEMILLEADILELKANPKRLARGIIIESKLDKGKGPVATVLVQQGTLRVGNLFVAGQYGGKVRAMYNERNQKIKEAPPSTPVQVVGFEGVPQAGDTFVVLRTEREVREISTKRQQIRREQELRRKRHITLDQIAQRIKHGEVRELNLIIKADVVGSIEALTDALMKLATDEVAVNVIHKAVGGISESDVLLASASQAIIIGFQVRPSLQARELAEKENVDIRLYRVIYDAVEDVRAALEGMLEPEVTEELTGTLEVRQVFKVPKVGTVAGCYVVSGKVSRNDLTRIYREDKLLNESKITSLKRFKDDVKEVAAGFECGVGIEGFDDIKVGDIIETYKLVTTARKLKT